MQVEARVPAEPRLAAASTCRSFGSGRARPGSNRSQPTTRASSKAAAMAANLSRNCSAGIPGCTTCKAATASSTIRCYHRGR